ncbi:MAG TPA: pentapeptide repeat-containing protein [Chlorobaculum sp.]|nr:pentapeptide repeat-containing protein [Chlorobaculum sp.]
MAADSSQLAVLRKGAVEWNTMRRTNPSVLPDLSKADLKGRRLRGINFSKANLAEANLKLSDLGQSDFQEADLHSADLSGAALSGCRFIAAEMSEVSLLGSSCVKADFSRAKLISSILRRVDFSRAILSGADLRGSDMRETVLQNTDLRGADLRGANLWRSNDGGMLVDGAIVSEETILPTGKQGSAEWAAGNRAVFKGANVSVGTPGSRVSSTLPTSEKEPQLIDVTPSRSRKQDDRAPEEAVMPATVKSWQPKPKSALYDSVQLDLLQSNALKWNTMRKDHPILKINLKGADLDHKNLAYANLNGADLSGASLKNADLSRSKLQKALLRCADLSNANLHKADLREADLRGAKLWRANLDRANIEGAIVSENTVLNTGRKATTSWASENKAHFNPDGVPAR